PCCRVVCVVVVSMVARLAGCRVARVGGGRVGGRGHTPAMDIIGIDPTVPLPGPPEPWASTDTPSKRGGPPIHMTDMIAAEPALVGRVVGRLAAPDGAAAHLAEAIRDTLAAGA